MRKEESKFLSSIGNVFIRTVSYYPDGEIKAILQISHGMNEFIDRYEDFAHYLCKKGYLVVGNDHLGHGESVNSKDEWGYFYKEDGYKYVLEDLHILTKMYKDKYPNIPYFLLGHSMGSFFARYYICKYGNELDGAIIMGTGNQNKGALSVAKTLARSVAATKGWNYRSTMLRAAATGSYNKKWEPSKTHVDWLTKDEKIVNWYCQQPKCTFIFTVNGYYNLFSVIEENIKQENLNNMPKNLPILIISGENDPVGNFGKDPKDVFETFNKIGMKDVSIKLYPNDRHEILNELDKENVYDDINNWIESKKEK